MKDLVQKLPNTNENLQEKIIVNIRVEEAFPTGTRVGKHVNIAKGNKRVDRRMVRVRK